MLGPGCGDVLADQVQFAEIFRGRLAALRLALGPFAVDVLSRARGLMAVRLRKSEALNVRHRLRT